jgi:ferric-dicitrate binding protein FerR (iron transport regulator)
MKPWETDETFLARWLSKSLTEEERAAFEASEEYETYVQTAQALDGFEVEDYDAKAAYAALKARIDAQRPQAKTIAFRPLPYVAIAAAFILLAGLIYWQTRPTVVVMEEVVASARQELSLPDGSRLDMQAGSLLRYNKAGWEENRSIYFEGKAYFDITEGKRFDIELRQGQVRILGTRFDILELGDSLLVNCYEGRVQVESGGEQTILTAGLTVIALPGSAMIKDSTALSQPLWLSDFVELNNIPLSSAIKQLEEIYQIEISGDYEEKMLTRAAFPTNDLDVALQQVLGSFSITYTIDSSGNVIVVE